MHAANIFMASKAAVLVGGLLLDGALGAVGRTPLVRLGFRRGHQGLDLLNSKTQCYRQYSSDLHTACRIRKGMNISKFWKLLEN